MIHAETRPLTAEERRILEGLRKSPSSGGAPFAAFLSFLMTSGVLLVIMPAEWQSGVRSLAPVAVALLVAAGVYFPMRSDQRRSPFLRSVTRDLGGGVAEITTYRVTDAIMVEEAEDEGSQYYLQLEDGRVVFLAGQHLYEAEEEGRFPSSVVKVTRAPAANVVLGLACEGVALMPSGRRASFSKVEYLKGIPADGALLDVDFESLRRGPA